MNQEELTEHILNIDWKNVSEPRYWLHNLPLATLFVNAFSIASPHGESYCIKALKEIKSQINDLNLKNQVQQFIQEECNHTLVHKKFNNFLKVYGYPIESLSRKYKFTFSILNKNYSIKTKAAIACAFEFISSSMATLGIGCDLFPLGQSKAIDFMHWHSLEEFNHKEFLFDVYKDIGGGYFRRVFVFLGVLLLLVSMGSFSISRMLVFDIYHKKYSLFKNPEPSSGFSLTRAFFIYSKKLISYLKPNFIP